MNTTPYAYAQARLQAHYARLPDAGARHRLNGSGGYGHLLQELRHGELRGWVAGISAEGEVHTIAAHLRQLWRLEVDLVAGWLPTAWRTGIQWLVWLPELPAIALLLAGSPPPSWVRHDPLLRHFADGDPQRRRNAFAASPLAALLPATLDRPLDQLWLTHWRRQWPQPLPALERLAQRLAQLYAEQRGEAAPLAAAHNQAEALLRRAFRAHPFTPVAAAAYLTLAALTLGWLDGALASRALFGREGTA